MRKRKLALNISMSLLLRIVTIACGFVLPQLMLKAFGSATNGLVNSIAQFLSIISFLELGVGAVVESALYKPLANKNEEQLSKVIASAQKFFKKLALIFLAYIAVLIVIYPNFTDQEFDTLFTATLIVAISVKSFAENYFGIVDNLLLNADQYSFVSDILGILTVLLNTIASIILINCGQSIHVIKITSALISMLVPLCQRLYVNKHYKLDRHIRYDGEPIGQKWNGVAQHVAAVVLDSTDNIVLTVFSTLQNVSIYSVYHLVVFGVRQLTESLTSGVQALLGELWAKQEQDELIHTFGWIEWVMHTVVVFVFGCTTILLLPFIQVYTDGITDADYIQPLFGILISLANAICCLREPYILMILAAGHYKQTQKSYIVATILNIVISVFTVAKYGLIGVTIGTLLAMLYQTIWMAVYDSRNLIKWPVKKFIKQLLVDTGTFIIAAYISSFFNMTAISYFSWFILAVKVALIWLCVIFVFNLVFYPEKIKHLIRSAREKLVNDKPESI